MKKKILIIAAIIASLLLVLGVLEASNVTDFVGPGKKSTPQVDNGGPTIEEEKATAEAEANAKKDLIENSKTSETTGSSNSTPQTAPTIELSANKEADSTVTVFTKLYKIGSGTCALNVTNGSKQSSQTASVVYQPEYSTCAGFSVPIASLGVGNWSITLNVSASGQNYTKNITYEVK